MKTALRFHAILLALAALAIAGCDSGSSFDGSIYYHIENEQIYTDSSLDNDANYFSVARLGPDAAPVYYVACGQIRSGSVAATATDGAITWGDALPDTVVPAGSLCNGLVAFGGALYGSFIPYKAGGSMGLYTSAVDPTGKNPGAFSQVAALAGSQVIRVASSAQGGGRLLVVTAEGAQSGASSSGASTPYTNYKVHGSYDGASFTVLYDAGTSVVKDLAYQASTGTYWLVFDSKLLRLDASTLAAAEVTPSGLASDEKLTAVHCCSVTSSSRVYLASIDGRIRFTDDSGTSWTSSEQTVISSTVIPFLSFTEVPAYGGATARVLAGSEGYGYYTVSVSGSTVALERYGDTTYADLRSSAIRRFYVDSHASGVTLFALTTTFGLWREEVASTVVWNQE